MSCPQHAVVLHAYLHKTPADPRSRCHHTPRPRPAGPPPTTFVLPLNNTHSYRTVPFQMLDSLANLSARI